MDNPNKSCFNVRFAKKRIGDLELKYEWIAVSIGVSSRTISRWMNGDVRHIRFCNIKALAECLNCHVSDLLIKGDSDVVDTLDDPTMAAEVLLNSQVPALLMPSENSYAAEILIKSVICENLPNHLLGRLYNSLAEVAMIQLKYDNARKYAGKALDIARKIDDGKLVWRAQLNLGRAAMEDGNLQESFGHLNACLEGTKTEGSEEDLLFYLGMASFYNGDLQEASDEVMASLKKAVAHPFDAPKQAEYSRRWLILGDILCELGRPEACENAYLRAQQLAEKANFRWGVEAARLGLAQNAAAVGKTQFALSLIEQTSAEHFKCGRFELMTTRVLLHLGRFDRAGDLIDEGLRKTKLLPNMIGLLYLEKARWATSVFETKTAKQAQLKAREAFLKVGSRQRAENLIRSPFFGAKPGVDAAPQRLRENLGIHR